MSNILPKNTRFKTITALKMAEIKVPKGTKGVILGYDSAEYNKEYGNVYFVQIEGVRTMSEKHIKVIHNKEVVINKSIRSFKKSLL